MATNLQDLPNNLQDKQSIGRQRQTRLRADAEATLRDIAFVLKMTQKVREELHAELEQQETICV